MYPSCTAEKARTEAGSRHDYNNMGLNHCMSLLAVVSCCPFTIWHAAAIIWHWLNWGGKTTSSRYSASHRQKSAAKKTPYQSLPDLSKVQMVAQIVQQMVTCADTDHIIVMDWLTSWYQNPPPKHKQVHRIKGTIRQCLAQQGVPPHLQLSRWSKQRRKKSTKLDKPVTVLHTSHSNNQLWIYSE